MSTLPFVNEFFDWCVLAIAWFGDITGMGYNLANIFFVCFSSAVSYSSVFLLVDQE